MERESPSGTYPEKDHDVEVLEYRKMAFMGTVQISILNRDKPFSTLLEINGQKS